MSKKDTSNIVLENKAPIKSAVRGQTLYVYDQSSGAVISGTVETVSARTVILRTVTGLHPYWLKECFTEKESPEEELNIRLHPVRERLIGELRTAQDLLSFCIHSDFTNDKDAADMREAVSVRAKELLGFDPFADFASEEIAKEAV